MVSYIKSKVQQSLSFLIVLVIAFSVFSGVLFLNPSPSYAYNESDFSRARIGDKDLSGADLSGADLSEADLSEADLSGANLSEADLIEAIADSQTKFPYGFDAVGAGVRRIRP
jgi:hypothetical protein